MSAESTLKEPDVTTERGLCMELSPQQKAAREEFRAFVASEIHPHAGRWEREERLPVELIDQLRQRHWIGAPLATELGGGGMDLVTYGILTEEIGRGCSSVRSLLTVHDMTTLATSRWGSPRVKEELVPKMARGELLCGLGLTEPTAGSDAANAQTVARLEGDEYVLDGVKKWITYGQIADLFLVLAKCEGKNTTFLVPADSPGFSRVPLSVDGTAASLVAELRMEGCRIPADHRVGRVGFGFSHVIFTALDHGRYSVACGAVGIAQACVDACLDYSSQREQGGKLIKEHQLIQRMLTEMIVNTRAARLLCYRAGYLRQQGDPDSATETLVAKYFASRAAVRAANDAIQLHGANGMSRDYPVGRYWRDAKVTEIIEGSTQIQQITIASWPPGDF